MAATRVGLVTRSFDSAPTTGNQDEPVRPTKLFIGGISRRTTTKQLRDHFAAYGRVLDCVAMRRPDGHPRGFGYVTLNTPAAAGRVLMEPQMIDDRIVDVKPAVPDAGDGAPTYACGEMQWPCQAYGMGPAGFHGNSLGYNEMNAAQALAADMYWRGHYASQMPGFGSFGGMGNSGMGNSLHSNFASLSTSPELQVAAQTVLSTTPNTVNFEEESTRREPTSSDSCLRYPDQASPQKIKVLRDLDIDDNPDCNGLFSDDLPPTPASSTEPPSSRDSSKSTAGDTPLQQTFVEPPTASGLLTTPPGLSLTAGPPGLSTPLSPTAKTPATKPAAGLSAPAQKDCFLSTNPSPPAWLASLPTPTRRSAYGRR